MTADSNTADGDFEKATTVTIIVHGVGDHSPIDILQEAELGLGRLNPSQPAMLARIQVPWLAPLGNVYDTKPVSALKIETQNQTHIILPVVWSGVRFRAASRWLAPSGMMGDPLAKSTPALLSLFVDLFHCVPKAGRISWKVAIASVIAVLAGFVLFLTLASMYVWGRVLSSWGTAQSWRLFGALIVGYAVLEVLNYLCRRALIGLDFFGDVACYVGREKFRRRLKNRLGETIATVRLRCRDATIIFVGHSLGSVLVAQTLQEWDDSLGPRTILLTLGSPLKLLSKVFPSIIDTPQAVSEGYRTTRAVAFWQNLWRDSDPIGRNLDVGTSHFAEKSLGPGGHSNYWSDIRFWESLLALLRQLKQPEIPTFVQESRSDNLTEAESAELQALTSWIVGIYNTYAKRTLICLAISGLALVVFRRSFHRVGPSKLLTIFWTIWSVYLISLWVNFWWMISRIRFKGSKREQHYRVVHRTVAFAGCNALLTATVPWFAVTVIGVGVLAAVRAQ